MIRWLLAHTDEFWILYYVAQRIFSMGILDKKHTDWPWPFSLIPRRWTAFNWGVPELVKGNIRPQDTIYTHQVSKADILNYRHVFAPKPISSEGTWQLSRFPEGPWYAWYFALSGKRKADGKFRHWRIGARWDDVDGYTQFPAFATRRFTGGNEQDTSVR